MSDHGSDSARAPAPEPILPPVLEPVPTPVPGPAVLPLNEAFAASQLLERLPASPPSVAEVRLRLNSRWQAPSSPLRLADRSV